MVQKQERFIALDVFRGLTVCFMIIVNSPGAGSTPFPPLLHANWHGFTATDLVFPSFLFAVGMAMSFAQRKMDTLSNRKALLKITKRAFIIFLIGYLIYWFPFFSYTQEFGFKAEPIQNTRIPGVLQRIALCYLLCSLLVRYLKTQTVYLIAALILVGYWMVLYYLGSPNDPYSMSGNFGLVIDKMILGDNHLYHGEGIAFDPEGILSTFPSLVNVIIGYYVGVFIQKSGRSYETIAKLFLIGTLFILIALVWDLSFPINKKLWSSSFTLLTAGLDSVLLAILIYLTDIKKHGKSSITSFFLVFGMNALFIYIVSELLLISLLKIPIHPGTSLFQWISISIFQNIISGPIGSLLFALCFMATCWGLGYILYKKKIYIHV